MNLLALYPSKAEKADSLTLWGFWTYRTPSSSSASNSEMRRETPAAMAMSTLYRWLCVQNRISLILGSSYCTWEERGTSLCTFGHFVSDRKGHTKRSVVIAVWEAYTLNWQLVAYVDTINGPRRFRHHTTNGIAELFLLKWPGLKFVYNSVVAETTPGLRTHQDAWWMDG